MSMAMARSYAVSCYVTVSLLLCFTTFMTGCFAMLDCEGNRTTCLECLKDVLGTIPDLKVYVGDEKITCDVLVNSIKANTDYENLVCLDDAYNDYSTVSIHIAPFYAAWDLFYSIHTDVIQLAKNNSDPLCGYMKIKVVAEDPILFEEIDDYVCTVTIAANSSAIMANIRALEETYVWKGSAFHRQYLNYTRCLYCPQDVLLFDSDNIIEVNATHLRVSMAQDTSIIQIFDVPYGYFIELENGSFVVCLHDDFPTVHGNPLTSRVPKMLTIILIFISLISLIITFITYCVFPELRNLPGKIVMNFLTALFVALLTTLIDLALPSNACVSAGPVFHFFWLAAFVWMNALSINTSLTLTRPTPMRKHTGNRNLLQFMAYGWGAPGIIVTISLILHFCECTNMTFRYEAVQKLGEPESCWIGGDSLADILLNTLIVSILLCINVVLFIYTFCVVRGVAEGTRSMQQDRSSNWEYWIFIKLSLLMGLPWLLEKPAELLRSSPVLEYIYIILNALQGFFVFIVLVVTSRAKRMWAIKLQETCNYSKRNLGTSAGASGTRSTNV